MNEEVEEEEEEEQEEQEQEEEEEQQEEEEQEEETQEGRGTSSQKAKFEIFGNRGANCEPRESNSTARTPCELRTPKKVSSIQTAGANCELGEKLSIPAGGANRERANVL